MARLGSVNRVPVTVDGLAWERKPGSIVSAEEFLQARAVVADVHAAMCWNPWVLEDRAADYEAAWQAIGQWSPIDPDAHPLALEEAEAQLEQRLAEADARFEAAERQAERDRAARAASYDPEREQARLALLEGRAMLTNRAAERTELQQSPCQPGRQQRAQLAKLEREITELTSEVERLTSMLGDEEAVTDANGWLPAERRNLALTLFKASRQQEVRELRARIAAGQADLKATTGRSERAVIREALRKDTCRLEYLAAIAPMTAADMCSECPTPAAWHDVDSTYGEAGKVSGPCHAWPRQAAADRLFREAFTKLLAAPAATPPPPPKPQPIAVINAGLPIEEVMAQLAAVQAEHPGAMVRPWSRKRWEIWPSEQTPG
jgi:hypothetical protein